MTIAAAHLDHVRNARTTTRPSTVVIPAAGLGSRMLPASAAVPKELLPVAGVPALQWLLDEAVAASIDHVVVVSARWKHALERYVEMLPATRDQVFAQGNVVLAARLDAAAALRVSFVYQDEPLGLGHAVSCATPALRPREAFVVALPDEVFPSCSTIQGLVDVFNATTTEAVVAVQDVAPHDVHRYGIVAPTGTGTPPGVRVPAIKVAGVVEKPALVDAPSTLAVVGRYVLAASMLDRLQALTAGTGGELQLTDALHAAALDEPWLALTLDAPRFDVGTPAGLVAASVALLPV